MKLDFLRSIVKAVGYSAPGARDQQSGTSPTPVGQKARAGDEDEYRYGRDYELFYWMPGQGPWYY
ncbi:hypothetical protein ACFFP0_06030 [Rhizobium puerariae]|uniref:Uncharacterized protein n=1 Tax=Rhizobium puerariae TaxID=1585791 RepID=A0ABV6AE69_9HYPH